jgi:hypothetical protein
MRRQLHQVFALSLPFGDNVKPIQRAFQGSIPCAVLGIALAAGVQGRIQPSAAIGIFHADRTAQPFPGAFWLTHFLWVALSFRLDGYDMGEYKSGKNARPPHE